MRDSYTLYQDKLEGEYKEVFKQIDTYFGTEKVDDDTREERMGELLDIFLLAQEEGRSVDKITGKNIESFCKNFCSNLTWHQKVLSILDLTKSISVCVFGMSLLSMVPAFFDMLGGKIVNIWEIRAAINIFGYLCGFLIVIFTSYVCAAVTRRIMFKVKRISMIIWEVIVGVIAVVLAFVMIVLPFKDSVYDFPAWVVCVISGIYLLLYHIFNKNRILERKEHEMKFWDEIKKETEFDANTDNLFSQEMEKKWEKRNKKRLKQGKQAFTRAEILALEEAEILKAEENQWAYWFFPIVITVGMLIFAEFETKTDMYWFGGIVLVVEYVLMALLWKGAKSGNVNRRKWIEAERKKLTRINDMEEA